MTKIQKLKVGGDSEKLKLQAEDYTYFSEQDSEEGFEVVNFLKAELPSLTGMTVEASRGTHVKYKEEIMGIERKVECGKCHIFYKTKPKTCMCQMPTNDHKQLKICDAKHGVFYDPHKTDYSSCPICIEVMNMMTPKQQKIDELNRKRRRSSQLEDKLVLEKKKEGLRRKEHAQKEHDAKIQAKAFYDEKERRKIKKRKS